MDLIPLSCPAFESHAWRVVMAGANLLGHGLLDGGVAVAIVVAGVVLQNPRVRRAGLAALLAVIAAGLLANILKEVFQLPRPNPGNPSYGFPSGHATTAFALAGALGRALPALAPLAYGLALLVGVARVYFRYHSLIDVFGGAILGTGVGLLSARWLRAPLAAGDGLPVRRRVWAWAIAAGIGIVPLAFLIAYDHTVGAHRAPDSSVPVGSSSGLVVTFGSPDARALLRNGWGEDEMWGGLFPFAWAEGLESTLHLPTFPRTDYTVRLRMLPFLNHDGLSCQTVEVAFHGVPVARLLLERGWHDYELLVPKSLVSSGVTEVRFRFRYAHAPRRPDTGGDGRSLSVAFVSLVATPRGAPEASGEPR